MKIRKILLSVAVFMVVTLGLAINACATESTHLTVEQVGAPRGGTVSVNVVLDQVSGISGGNFNVVYDNTTLTLVSAVPGIGGGTVNTHYADNAVRLSFANFTALSQPGSLLTLTFKVSESAPLKLLPVSLERMKFYDESAKPIAVEAVAGGVQVQAVEMKLSSDSCLPGQAVKLEASIAGGLYPSGGEFEITYNPRMLSAGSIKAEQKMGDTMINLSYRIDEENSIIYVSWAAGEPITELGRLCTVIFAVSEYAVGDTCVTIQNMKFYDETGTRMDVKPAEDAVVTVVDTYKEQPTLYIVGGKLAEDGTATVQIAIDGAGVVCGGSFQLTYDAESCELTQLTRVKTCVATNPESVSAADGSVLVSWAEDSPALDNETILQLTCVLKGETPAALKLSDVVLKDKMGQSIQDIQVHDGEIGIATALQAPKAELIQTDSSVGIRAALYDAQFCDAEKTQAARYVLASYSGGKMSLVELGADAVTFDHNGIAHITADMDFDEGIDQMQMFVLDADDAMIPLCAKIQVSLD